MDRWQRPPLLRYLLGSGGAGLADQNALGTETAGRLKTAYMTGSYLAGGLGSWLGTRAYTLFGWTGVCALVALLAGLALARHLTPARTAAAPVEAVTAEVTRERGRQARAKQLESSQHAR